MISTNNHLNGTKGFTLIELVFATTLLGIMLTLILSTFVGVFRFYVWAGTTPVSYTHLDVYKRQPIYSLVGDGINPSGSTPSSSVQPR